MGGGGADLYKKEKKNEMGTRVKGVNRAEVPKGDGVPDK